MTVKIALNTASGNYQLCIPRDNLLIYHSLPKIMPVPTQDIEAIIRRGMAHPLGAAPLPKLLEGAKTAAVIVDDWARPVVTRHTVAPIVLNLLNEHGLGNDDITLVMARGVGLSPSVETIDSAFGPALQARAVRKKINSYQPSCLDSKRFSNQRRLYSPLASAILMVIIWDCHAQTVTIYNRNMTFLPGWLMSPST